MIETRLLVYFLAVAREQSITKAAEVLHISQSTLSKQMMDLEYSLGKTLFNRGSRNISLTDDGVFLRAHAQEIVSLVEKTETALRSGAGSAEGDIFLGCGETAIMKHVIRAFQELKEDSPGLRLHIFSGNAESVTERLESGLLDMGLLLGAPNRDKYDSFALPYRDSFGLLLRRSSPLAGKDLISAADLTDLPMIVPSQSGHEAPYPNISCVAGTYNLISNATYMVEQGLGCALCLADLVTLAPDRNLVFRPISPPVYLDARIVTKKYQSFSTPAKLFLDRLRSLN